MKKYTQVTVSRRPSAFEGLFPNRWNQHRIDSPPSVYDSLIEAVRSRDWGVLKDFGVKGRYHAISIDFRDENNDLIPHCVIAAVARNHASTYYSYHTANDECRDATARGFRQIPIPGTGQRRRYTSYYRYPRTTGEIRSNVAAEEEGFRVRPKRNHLPTHWDDIPRWDRSEDNWKRYRNKQYRD